MITCCQVLENHKGELFKVLKEGEQVDCKKEANLKFVRIKNVLLLQFLFLENEARKKGEPALCAKCFYFIKDFIKATSKVEEILKREEIHDKILERLARTKS